MYPESCFTYTRVVFHIIYSCWIPELYVRKGICKESAENVSSKKRETQLSILSSVARIEVSRMYIGLDLNEFILNDNFLKDLKNKLYFDNVCLPY